MVTIVSDDKAMEKALRRLCSLIIKNGGFLYDGLTISAEQGDFKITVDESKAEGELIIALPAQCLLPVEKFRLGLDGDDIVITEKDPSLSDGQIALLETMMELFNLSGKIEQQRQTATLSVYHKDRALYDELVKSYNEEEIPFLDKVKTTDREQYYLDSFIKSRVLGLKSARNDLDGYNEESVAASKNAPNKTVQVLMPVIDFLNHDPRAAQFIIGQADKSLAGEEDAVYDPGTEAVSIAKCCPFDDSNECYVNYGPFDTVDTLIHYNYVERGATFVRSVPVTVKIPGVGTIVIRGVIEWPRFKTLSEKIKDLRFYIPVMEIDSQNKLATLGSLFIPQEKAPRALRRVLNVVFNQLDPSLDGRELKDAILYAEKRVIEENLKHYKTLCGFMDSYKPKPCCEIIADNIRDMAHIQVEKIQSYPFYDEALRRNRD